MTRVNQEVVDLTLPDGAGPLVCPVDGCGCANQHIGVFDIGKYPDGTDVYRLDFFCEWGHGWRLSFNEHDGATIYTVEAWEDHGE